MGFSLYGNKEEIYFHCCYSTMTGIIDIMENEMGQLWFATLKVSEEEAIKLSEDFEKFLQREDCDEILKKYEDKVDKESIEDFIDFLKKCEGFEQQPPSDKSLVNFLTKILSVMSDIESKK